MKGIAPIAVAAIALASTTLIWGVAIHWFVGEHETVVRSEREREIIKLINEMEWIKRVIPQALEYSFYQSSYLLASQGGYFDPNTVASYNCIPYWKVYDSMYFNDDILKENLDKSLIKHLTDYANILKINLPDYETSYQQENDGTIVSIKSNDNLVVERGIAKVEDEANFTGKFNLKIFQIFETGKEFLDKDSVSSAIDKALGAPCEELKDRITDELKNLETDRIKIEVEDVQTDCKGHAAVKALVKITDGEKYPVYDYNEKTTSLRDIQLKFYVISGNAKLIEAETNICS